MRFNRNLSWNKQESGFLLIWLTIAILVIGLAVATAINAYKIREVQNYIDVTRNRMETINQALSNYAYRHGHLPCVAPYTLPRTDPQYAQSVTCASGSPTPGNIARVTNSARGNRAVWVGAVPVRTLNLSDKYMYDVNGNLFTYAVTENVTTGILDATLGAIDIVDETGTTTLTPAGSALYALVSHGLDGKGAYYSNDVTGGPVAACTSSAGNDQENCNQDHIFRDADYSMGQNAQYFDDFIVSSASFVPNCGLQGRIYNGTECVTPRDSFGGTYIMWSGDIPMGERERGVTTPMSPYPENASCRSPNALTGSCTCPAGYARTSIWEWWNPPCLDGFYSTPGPRTRNCNVHMYICLRE